jgi:hypothetical protein
MAKMERRLQLEGSPEGFSIAGKWVASGPEHPQPALASGHRSRQEVKAIMDLAFKILD